MTSDIERKWVARVCMTVVIASALAFLIGCNQGAGETQSDRTMVDLLVHWQSADQVNATCRSFGLTGDGQFNGCARTKPGDSTVCEIYAVEPRNFEDAKALQALGHEAWHCLGATHPG